jgi:hypothetical protein
MASNPTASAHDQVDVNNFETGEWLNYTLNVSTAGAYNVALNVSASSRTARSISKLMASR